MNKNLTEDGFLGKNSITSLIQSIERNRKLAPNKQMPKEITTMPLAGKYSDML